MTKLEEDDKDTWDYLKENFSAVKSEVPSTSIGSDYALEQENKNLKVNGGITGLTQIPSMLSRFCLFTPVISSLLDDYMKKYDIQHIWKRKSHYQLTRSHLKRLCDNVIKLKAEVDNCNVTFTENNAVMLFLMLHLKLYYLNMLLMSCLNMIRLERTCMKNLSPQECKVKNRFGTR